MGLRTGTENDSKSGLASTNHTANLSGLILEYKDADFCRYSSFENLGTPIFSQDFVEIAGNSIQILYVAGGRCIFQEMSRKIEKREVLRKSGRKIRDREPRSDS